MEHDGAIYYGGEEIPFISVQKDFGYSDVTHSNNVKKGQIETLFKKTERRLSMIHKVFHNHAENIS